MAAVFEAAKEFGFNLAEQPDKVPERGQPFRIHASDERALRSSKYRARLATAVVDAAENYFARIEEANRK